MKITYIQKKISYIIYRFSIIIQSTFLQILIKLMNYPYKELGPIKITYLTNSKKEYLENDLNNYQLKQLEYFFENKQFAIEIDKIRKANILLLLVDDNYMNENFKKTGHLFFLKNKIITSWIRIVILLYIGVENDKKKVESFINKISINYNKDLSNWQKFIDTRKKYNFFK